MTFQRDKHVGHGQTAASRRDEPVGTPGKRTLTEQIAPRPPASTSGGRPLPDDVRAQMEQRLGADFSAVRIHEGGQAAAVGARAYTQGTDVYFAPGEYDPHGARGQELLGHELVHVMHQGRGPVGATGDLDGAAVNDDPALEREADEGGARAARGGSDGEAAARAPAPPLAAAPSAAAPIQRKALTAGDLRTSMTTTMRRDVPAGLAAIDPVLGSEPQLLAEGLDAAKLIYVQECERLKLKAPLLGATLPLPAALTQDAVAQVHDQIKLCVEITDSMAEEHWAEHQASWNGTKETYVASRHQAERQKAASGWAQAAASVVRIADRAHGGTGLTEQIKRNAEKREGRDLNGRLGYFLMSTATDDTMKQLGVDATDHMTGRAQGAGALADRLTDLFSSAACHKDARDMCDLLSQQRHGEVTKRIVESEDEVPAALGSVMSAISSCPGPTKLLKLSVYNNHSMLFVIGEDEAATKLETVAAQDSKSIMINDLIRNQVSLQSARASVAAGLASLCKSEGSVELEYEVHQAATMEGVEGRVQDRLSERMTQLGVGMAVGSWEMADLHERQQDLLELKGEDLEDTYGVAPIAKRQQLKVPARSARGGRLTFHALASDTVVDDPQAGAEYRIESEGSWLHVKVDNVVEDGQPAWLYPMLALSIINVNPNLSRPVLPKAKEVTKKLAMWNGAYRNFNLQQLKSECLKGRVFVNHSDEQWTVTADDAWEGGSMMRDVTMTQV